MSDYTVFVSVERDLSVPATVLGVFPSGRGLVPSGDRAAWRAVTVEADDPSEAAARARETDLEARRDREAIARRETICTKRQDGLICGRPGAVVTGYCYRPKACGMTHGSVRCDLHGGRDRAAILAQDQTRECLRRRDEALGDVPTSRARIGRILQQPDGSWSIQLGEGADMVTLPGTIQDEARAIRSCRESILTARGAQVHEIERSTGLPFDSARCRWLGSPPVVRIRRQGSDRDEPAPIK